MNSELLEGRATFVYEARKNRGLSEQNKWLNQQFEKGLHYIQVLENQKQVGFIEYTDAEYSSRVVHADGYVVIHCLWVSAVGKGYGTQLLKRCLKDAKERGKKGVVVITNDQTSWTPSKDLFLQHQFQHLATALNDFELWVFPFHESVERPYFPDNWQERLTRFPHLTILRSFQCPYVDVATENIQLARRKIRIATSAGGSSNERRADGEITDTIWYFSVVYKGQLIAFHRLTVHSVYKNCKNS